MGRTYRNRCRNRKHKNVDKDNDNHNNYIILQKFLLAKGWKNETNLKIGRFERMGRGIYSKTKLEENLIEIPFDCLVSIFTLESDLNFKRMFDENKFEFFKNEISFQGLLALYLSYQKTLGDSSEWHPYIQTLPISFSNPYFCEKLELHFLPEAILEKIVEQNSLIKKNYANLMEILKNGPRTLISLDLFKWSYFVCNTRSVYLNSSAIRSLISNEFFKTILSDSQNMALAPFLDFFNHSPEITTISKLSQNESQIERNAEKIKSKEASLFYQLSSEILWKKRQQIFINYGNFNNTKLFLEYGFFVPGNSCDFLEFSLNDINNYIKSHSEHKFLLIPKHKYKFIKEHELENQIYVDLQDGLSHNFQAILAILLIPSNVYNLTEVAFGEDIGIDTIKDFAIEILDLKKLEYQKLGESLKKIDGLSESGKICVEYYQECCRFIDKVLKIFN